MTPPIRYMIIFKDGQHEVPLYVGPFVSLNDAENFTRELPRPRPGGKVTVRECYAHGNLALIKDIISRARTPPRKPKLEALHA